jgi:hypothetical protein
LETINTFLWDQPIDKFRIYRQPPPLIGQFLHENGSIKTAILVFLDLFSQFLYMLLWPDPMTTVTIEN